MATDVMDKTQPIFNRSKLARQVPNSPKPAPQPTLAGKENTQLRKLLRDDDYLHDLATAQEIVSVSFIDGEVLAGRISQVRRYSFVLKGDDQSALSHGNAGRGGEAGDEAQREAHRGIWWLKDLT